MVLRFRTCLAILCTVLLLWQAGLAPLAHASAAHPASEIVPQAQSHADPVAGDKAAMPCHGEEAGKPVAMADHSDHGLGPVAAPSTATSVHGTEGPDCCQSFECQCACLHASLGSLAMVFSAHVVPDHLAVLGQALPALRARVVDLFKPPI